MAQSLKNYILVFEDRDGNDLTTKKITAFNLKDAKRQSQNYKANSMMNDLHKIVIHREILGIGNIDSHQSVMEKVRRTVIDR